MKFSRIVSLFLAVVTAAAVLTACVSTPPDTEDTQSAGELQITSTAPNAPGSSTAAPQAGDSTAASGTDAPETTLSEEEAAKPQATDIYRGTDYRIIAATNLVGNSDLYFSSSEGYTGSAVSDALYARALLMEDLYGIKLNITISDKATENLRVAFGSGEYICDISFVPGRDTFSLMLTGAYTDLNSLDALNLENSYWDQRIQKEYAIGNRLYTLEGDYTILDELRTYVCVYNDKLYRDYGYYDTYGTPYSMVADGKWTYDKMMTMIKGMYKDINSNGKHDEVDEYGMVGELTCGYYFFLGSGRKMIKNENGNPTLLISDSSSYAAIYDTLEATMQMAATDSDVLMPQLLTVSDKWGAASDIFESDRALFRSTALSAVTSLTDMKSSYGILPIPAFDENQDGYYCWVSGVHHHPLAIPTTVADADKTAAIAELLCYHSKYGNESLYKAFFEVMKIAKLCRQTEDEAMLDLVFNSKTFDFDYTTEITKIETNLYSIAKSGNLSNLNSTITVLRKTSEANLKKFLDQINK